MEIEDYAEESTRNKMKLIIGFLEAFRTHIESEGRRIRDYKKMMWGQKYKISDVLDQIESILNMMKTFLEESPTAAQILDLDNLSGMRSETIKGDPIAWKRLHLYLLKLTLQNRILFDYVKFEVLRTELDSNADSKNKWVLWEQKSNHADLVKLGCICGILDEAVNLGSIRRGAKKREDQLDPEYEPNYWSTSP